MRRIKMMVALMMTVMVLLSMSGCAEEPTGAQIPITPTNQDTSMDMPIDDEGLSDDATDNGGTTTLEFGALELDTTSADLDYSQKLTISATMFPSGETLHWSSSDETAVALSAESGRSVDVVAVNEGTSTITCTAGSATQTCTVTVNAPQTLQITGVDYPSSLKAAGRGWKLRLGTLASIDDLTELTSSLKDSYGEMIVEAYRHTFTDSVKRYEIKGIDKFVPFSRLTTEGLYTWILSATDAAGRTVSMDLPIQVVATGETIVSNNPGVYSPIIISADGNAAQINPGESKQLTASLQSGDGAGSELAWVSIDPDVASVSSSGMVTGVGAGTTTVICRTLDNSGVSAGFTVTVDGGANGDPVSKTDSEIRLGENDLLYAERNYAINSAFNKGLEDWNKRGPIQIFEIVNDDGSNWLHLKGDAMPFNEDSSNAQGAYQSVFQKYNLHAIPGNKYAISAKVRGAGKNQHCYFNLRWGRSDDSHIANAYHGFTLSEDAQIISTTVIAPAEADTITIHITTNCRSENDTVGNNETNEFYITDVKLELVNTPTAWTPALEDVASPVK